MVSGMLLAAGVHSDKQGHSHASMLASITRTCMHACTRTNKHINTFAYIHACVHWYKQTQGVAG